MTDQRPKITSPMTATMIECADFMRRNGGTIHRHPGGYWSRRDWNKTKSWETNVFGTNTVDGLVRRRIADYTEHRDGRKHRFPVAATLRAES